MLPFRDSSEAIRVSLLKLMNLEVAVTAKIPKITITIISSIRVKPCELIFNVHSLQHSKKHGKA